MLKATLLSLALLAPLMVTPPAQARHADEWSSARKTTHHYRHARRRAVEPGYAGQQQPGSDVCRGDALRMCKPVLGQGNMAVLGCFRNNARRLSRGCRGLLQSYGQL